MRRQRYCFWIKVLRGPFSLRKGWLLWTGIGLVVAIGALLLTGAAMSLFSGDSLQTETDALVRSLPLIGSSTISTACLVGIMGVLAPILEETVFRGFFLVSLTKWYRVPKPVAVLVSAAVFALALLTPGEFPQLRGYGIFVLSNSQTSNPHHNTCFLELRSNVASHLSAAARI